MQNARRSKISPRFVVLDSSLQSAEEAYQANPGSLFANVLCLSCLQIPEQGHWSRIWIEYMYMYVCMYVCMYILCQEYNKIYKALNSVKYRSLPYLCLPYHFMYGVLIKGQDTIDLPYRWKWNCLQLSAFSYVLRAMLTNTTNSDPCENVCSMFNWSFDDDQRSAYTDHIIHCAYLSPFVRLIASRLSCKPAEICFHPDEICMGVTWGSVGLTLEVDSNNTLRGTLR
jgi:hypothetical protein